MADLGVLGTDGEFGAQLTGREGTVFCCSKVASKVLISVKLDTNGSSKGFNMDSVELHTRSELSQDLAHKTGWGNMVSVPMQKLSDSSSTSSWVSDSAVVSPSVMGPVRGHRPGVSFSWSSDRNI